MTENLLTEGGAWLQQLAAASPPEKAALMVGGPSLARRIKSKSLDMQYSKATELSPDIPELCVLAAKVALVSGSGDLASYEADVYYWKIFNSTKKYVEEYDGFKKALGI